MPSPKRVFIGSAKEDAPHVDTLKKHLKLYERQNLIQIWDESMIMPGEIRNNKIEQELHAAEIILLLFSADLLAEDFIWGAEMTKILEKVKRKEVQLIPILLRPSGFADTPFAAYAAVPDREKPISNYPNKDEAWTIVVEQIKRSIQHSHTDSITPPKPESSMIPQSIKEKVNDLIGKGKTEDAIDVLIKWAHENGQDQLKNDATLLKSGLTKLKREEMLGMLAFAESTREMAKINNGLMSLMSLEAVSPTNNSTSTTSTTSGTSQPSQKLKILMLTANPAGTTEVNLNKEYARISEKLQGKTDLFNLMMHRSVNQEQFKQYTETEKPQILHFSGHGQGGADGGIIVQNDEHRGGAKISSDALDALFEYWVEEEGIPLESVVLNACYSQDQAEVIAKYVNYVVATTTEIADDYAIAFSVGFYFKLAETSDVEKSYKSGRTQAVMAGAKKTHFVLYKDGVRLAD
jgi:CHAT domain-containing protein